MNPFVSRGKGNPKTSIINVLHRVTDQEKKELPDADWLKNVCEKNKFTITQDQLEMIKDYVRVLLEWNKKINLISRRDEENVWQRHILGSIAFLFQRHPQQNTTLADVGTGGGLPGIPIAILRRDLDVTLVDSIRKKITVVDDIIDRIGLSGINTFCGRVEEMAEKREWKNHFDYIIARAVAPIGEIVKLSQNILKPGSDNATTSENSILRGSILLLKGGNLEEEMRIAVNQLKQFRTEVFPLSVQETEDTVMLEKKLVIITKMR